MWISVDEQLRCYTVSDILTFNFVKHETSIERYAVKRPKTCCGGQLNQTCGCVCCQCFFNHTALWQVFVNFFVFFVWDFQWKFTKDCPTVSAYRQNRIVAWIQGKSPKLIQTPHYIEDLSKAFPMEKWKIYSSGIQKNLKAHGCSSQSIVETQCFSVTLMKTRSWVSKSRISKVRLRGSFLVHIFWLVKQSENYVGYNHKKQFFKNHMSHQLKDDIRAFTHHPWA